MTIYSYTVARDYGFAPNPFGGYCTLACCKPKIRKGASIGDWVVGVGGTKNNLVGRIIYAMIVEEAMSFEDYWNDPRFQFKKPVLEGGHKGFFGDNIYRWDDRLDKYVQSNSHHSSPDGSTSTHNLSKDTGADRVLISSNYIYFGQAAVKPPADIAHDYGDEFPHWARDIYKSYPPELEERLKEWLTNSFEWGLQGLREVTCP
jgi:hypothetical protein